MGGDGNYLELVVSKCGSGLGNGCGIEMCLEVSGLSGAWNVCVWLGLS